MQTNNEIRGLEDGFNRGYTTLKKLVELGMKDVGFGITVQDKNAPVFVVRQKVRYYDRECWIIGTVSPAMHKFIWKPGV